MTGRRFFLRAGCLVPAVGLLLALAPPATAQFPWLKPRAKPPDYPDILVSAAWLRGHAADPGLVLVDARSAPAFQAEHIAGARSIDAWSVPVEPAALAGRFGAAGVSGSGLAVVYSDTRDPLAAGQLFWLLELAGHSGVRLLNGGIEAWKKAGGRPVGGPARSVPTRFRAVPDTSRLADFGGVLKAFGRRGHTVMDWRTPEAWATGHIPHSLVFPLADLLNSDGTIMDGPTMRPWFERFGPREREYVNLDDEFIVCGDVRPGGVPVHPYLAARLAGIARVRVYPEGFAGWQRHPEAPVVRIVTTEQVRSRLHEAWGRRLPDRPSPRFMLLDVRGEREYQLGHLPGAVSLPAESCAVKIEPLAARWWPGADRATIPVIFYCYGPGCTRSRNCSTAAALHGFLNLEWYKEGTVAWEFAGEKVVGSK